MQSPLSRFALRLRGVGARRELPENALAMALLLHAGVAIAGAAALLFVWDVPGSVAFVAGVGAFVALTIALHRPQARWIAVVVGTAFALATGYLLGRLSGRGAGGIVGGLVFGALCSAVAYGRLLVRSSSAPDDGT